MKSLRLFLIPILLLILAACGNVSTPAATLAPTVPTDASGLAQSASVQDMLGGELSVKYPAGWGSKTDGQAIQVTLASSTDLLATVSATQEPGKTQTLKPGQILIAISAIPTDLATGNLPEGTALSPKTFLDSAVTAAKTTTPALTPGTVTETTITGNPAARVSASTADEDVLLVAIAGSEAYLLAIVTTGKGDLAAQDALITSIIGSADYVKAAE